MRMNNAAIAVTLGCLSIVALVGLVFLPTPEIQASWTEPSTSYDVTSSSFSHYCGGIAAGWYVCASVSAGPGGASADASCGIRNITRFPMGKKGEVVDPQFTGSATVYAARAACTVIITVPSCPYSSSGSSCPHSGIPDSGHQTEQKSFHIPAKVDTNDPNVDPSRSTLLHAYVKIHDVTKYWATGTALTQVSAKEQTVTIAISSDLPHIDARAEGGATWTHTNGVRYETSASWKESDLIRRPHSVDRSASVDGRPEADKNASVTSFGFGDYTFEDQQVSYTAP